MTVDEFFKEAKRLNLRMLGTPKETCAALDAKDAEIERLRAALTDLCNAADSTNYPMHGPTWDRLWNCAVTARKALTPNG